MRDQMVQLVRQLNQQLSAMETENQRLKRQVKGLQLQLNRCVRIIQALLERSQV